MRLAAMRAAPLFFLAGPVFRPPYYFNEKPLTFLLSLYIVPMVDNTNA